MCDKWSCHDRTCGAPDCLTCRGMAAQRYRDDCPDEYMGEPDRDWMLEAKEARG